jgi:hypothetical protein
VIEYETALKADAFLVMAHGSATEIARAQAVLGSAKPSRLNVHASTSATVPANRLVAAGS